MNRKLLEAGSIISLIGALVIAGAGVARGIPYAWLLFVGPCVIFAVITISQRLPVTSLNLTVKVTNENASRIEPVARDFLATIKGYAMLLMAYVNYFAVFRVSTAIFFFVEGTILVAIFVSVFGFIGRINKLA